MLLVMTNHFLDLVAQPGSEMVPERRIEATEQNRSYPWLLNSAVLWKFWGENGTKRILEILTSSVFWASSGSESSWDIPSCSLLQATRILMKRSAWFYKLLCKMLPVCWKNKPHCPTSELLQHKPLKRKCQRLLCQGQNLTTVNKNHPEMTFEGRFFFNFIVICLKRERTNFFKKNICRHLW